MKRNTGVAMVLSFIIPGLGVVYCGRVISGVLIFLFSVAFLRGAIISHGTNQWINLVLFLVFWIAGIYRSKSDSEEINKQPNSAESKSL